MVSLPPAKEANIDISESQALSAYNVILNFERNANTDKEVLHARILGYLIIHAPSVPARHEMARVIHSCDQKHTTLSELGQHFLDWFIRPFKKTRGHTPASSSHSSRLSFDQERSELLANILEAPKDHKTAKMQALERDNYKCVVTGTYDLLARHIPEFREELARLGGFHMRCAHIVPESTYFDVSSYVNLPEERFYSSSVSGVLKRFGYDVDLLKGEKVHSLFNVMTMERNMHEFFDRLELYFEATQIENCYKIMVTEPVHVPKKVTFTSSNPDKLPAPSSQLLALHAACAKVAHFSGAGAYIDELDEDMEDMGVLAGDGRSAEVLTHALMRSMSTTHAVGVGE